MQLAVPNLKTRLLTARTFLADTLPVTRVRHLGDFNPFIALVLGSSQGSAAAKILPEATQIPFAAIPYFPRLTTPGHAGILHYGNFGNSNISVVVMQGRPHTHEGFSAQEAAFPVMAVKPSIVILTNSAGMINTDYQIGDLIIINDHCTLALDDDPLLSKPDLEVEAGFYPSQAYDDQLKQIAGKCLAKMGKPAHSGYYAFLGNRKHYESAKDIETLKKLGYDLVGMSTVPEALGAGYLGIKVLGISQGTNWAAGINGSVPNHEEVQQVGLANADFQAEFLRNLIEAIINA